MKMSSHFVRVEIVGSLTSSVICSSSYNPSTSAAMSDQVRKMRTYDLPESQEDKLGKLDICELRGTGKRGVEGGQPVRSLIELSMERKHRGMHAAGWRPIHI